MTTRPLAVERRPYKEHFVEVEVYKTDGRYKAWPYIGKAPSAYEETKIHFMLNGEFGTKQQAVEAAVREGQKRIDGQFLAYCQGN